MLKLSSASILIFLLFVLSCQNTQSSADLYVSEVIDGDTVRLSNGQTLRYIGIDTPEVRIKKGGRFEYQPQPFALEARELNKTLVEGKRVRIEFDVQRYDRYQRLLGYCFVDDEFINAKLLSEGLAVLYTYPPNIKYTELFVAAQKEARENKRGLWASYEIIDHTQAGNYINQIRTVRGRVVQVYKSSKCLFLNFGKDWKSDFTIVIYNNVLDLFRKQGIDPLTFYKGKTIEVSGRIHNYNGPEIIVNNPAEIQVIEP